MYHVLNRGNARSTLFEDDAAYGAFEELLAEGHQKAPMRTLAYCLMPNHWHLVLWPRKDGELWRFLRWVTMTHTQRFHAAHGTAGYGHVYQGRFKSFPVASADADPHYFAVCRYVERNALRARLVRRAERWRWCSLYHRAAGVEGSAPFLAAGPEPWPANWTELVNAPQAAEELAALRRCVRRGSPFGPEKWAQRIARRFGLASTLRPRGRPKKDQAEHDRPAR